MEAPYAVQSLLETGHTPGGRGLLQGFSSSQKFFIFCSGSGCVLMRIFFLLQEKPLTSATPFTDSIWRTNCGSAISLVSTSSFNILLTLHFTSLQQLKINKH